ncbi:MAG: gliding motility-associated C-terminal domain-containing protein [Prolixibacteraceae bacterium]|nr:gliding motility-associated C-terminal domain-containing protein [Prolixibacteraceae bacterium]
MKAFKTGFSSIKPLVIVFIFTFNPNLALHAQTGVAEADSLALVALYNATDGDHWTRNDNWLTGPVDTWWGIKTDGNNVTEIILCIERDWSHDIFLGNNLFGTLPPEIYNLNKLEVLYLTANQLTGSIPPEIGNLVEIVELDLGHNKLFGSIPPEIGLLTQLTYLTLSFNQLSGIIPHEIGYLSKLKGLHLKSNLLTGNIPDEICQLKNLINLDLAYNQLSGTIPIEIGQLTNLQGLSLFVNQITGSIPFEIGQLSELDGLELGWNQLSGNIPHEIGQLTNLEFLGLGGNKLSGNIPPEIGQLTNLKHFLSLGDNQLSGTIPSEIGNLINLEYLNLSNNSLTGSIPVEIENLTNLLNLELYNNLLTGEIPLEIGALSNLESLNLEYNQLSGSIPVEICSLYNLKKLALYGNQLSGSIPNEIGNLTNLWLLDFGGNNFKGSIPTSIGSLSLLSTFAAHDNQLTGSIPDEVFTLINLTHLNIAYNQLSSSIPSTIGNLINLQELGLQDNLFSELPDLSSLSSLNNMGSQDNKFTFEDFEINLDLILRSDVDFSYSPQLEFDSEYDTIAIEGSSFNLSIPCGGEYNHYQWWKNGAELDDAPDSFELIFPSIQLSDAGKYWVTVTNDSVPDLELTSMPVHISVQGQNAVNHNIRAYIDGGSQLIIHDSTIQWHHYSAVAPGRSEVPELPTYVYGEEWYPTWPDIPDYQNQQECFSSVLIHPTLILPEFDQMVQLEIIESRENVFIKQQPSATNDYTLIIEFDDNAPPGAAWFEVSVLWNLFQHPDVPVLVSPNNRSIDQSLSLTLNWINEVPIDSYTLQISTAPDFSSTVINQSEIITNNFFVDNLEENTQYHWRVNATNIMGTSEWSEVWDFTTQPPVPIVPLLVSPNNEAIDLSLPVIFNWNSSEFAESYTLQVSTTPNFSTPLINQTNLTENSYLLSDLQNETTYYWRISATNVAGTSDWSQIWEFKTLPPIPSVPELISPIYEADNQSLSVEFSWNIALHADSYTLQVSMNPDFSSPLINQNDLTENGYSAGDFQNETTYYWQVCATNAGGTSCSDVWQFTTIPEMPESPVLISPENNAENRPLSLQFNWEVTPNAENYTIQISIDPGFENIVHSQSNISSTSYSFENCDEETTYYWRVQATNVAGSGEWSETWSFSTEIIYKELEPVNLVIIDGAHPANFQIEWIEQYPDNTLLVFNRWGNKVYEKSSYNNDLDFSTYPEGTYYYVLTYKNGMEEKTIKNFVDVIKN